tara:strand:+ start:13479 stop:14540 length:1062 start_codon:yes stop_codon:yes gene_type:complete
VIYVVTFVIALALIVPGSMHRLFNLLGGLMLLTILCVMTSIRSDTGTDYPTYVAIWDNFPPLDQAHFGDLIGGFYEPLFSVVNALLKTFSSSQFLFFAFYACLTLIVLHVALQRIPRINLPYAYAYYFAVFLLPYTFNAMRQSIAMSIFLLAVPAVVERRTRMVLLLSLVAGGFHFSGFLIGVGYVFLRVCDRLGLKVWTVFLISAGVGVVMAATGLLSRIFFLIFPGTVEVYADLFEATSSVSNIVMRLGLCVLMLVGADAGRGERRHINALLTVYFLGLLIYLALFQFNLLATRFNMLFRVLEVVLFPLIAARLPMGRRLVFAGTTLALALATLLVTAAEPDYFYAFSLPF